MTLSPQLARKEANGFSLVELLTTLTVLSIIMLMLFGVFQSVSNTYIRSEEKVDANERARASLELFTRELTPAVVDTRMQFCILPGERLTDKGAQSVAENSPAVLWMAPLGKGGALRCVGYFLSRNTEDDRYRLKRIYIRDDNEDNYFPKLIDLENSGDVSFRTDPLTARWFTNNWNEEAFDDLTVGNEKVVVSTVAEGILGFWVQCYDTLGNPIPWLSEAENHPESDLMYNSAAYFHIANSRPFDDGKTFVYLAETPLVMKAHRLPAEIEMAIYSVGDDVFIRNQETEIPPMSVILDDDGALDLDASVKDFEDKLIELKINGELLTTRVKLTNGS